MKTYTCDNCGFTKGFKAGIVGNEFDYSKSFGTLAKPYRTAGVVDLCLPCMSAAEKALSDSRKGQAQAVNRGFFARFFRATQPERDGRGNG